MRIITGKAKGIRLVTLEGEATRPTSERVKEAVFSMLQFDIEGRRVLDLFSGSGQLALEAVSRGAAEAVLVDKSKDAVKIINTNIEKLISEKRPFVLKVLDDYDSRILALINPNKTILTTPEVYDRIYEELQIMEGHIDE